MKINKNKKRIFLDYASITPIDKRVKDKMDQIQKSTFANPSALYGEAMVAKEIMLRARENIAQILHTQSKEIIFTSGGTEGNNLAILGVFQKNKTKNFTPHFITVSTEHPAILEVFKEVERRGGEVTVLPVDEDGLLSLQDLRQSLKKNTVLVSVSYANNEIGTIQPIHSIARIIKDFRLKNNTVFPYLHTDACQAGLYLSLDVLKLGVDMMTLDGIKIYGPRGSGILYVKNNVEMDPVFFGGGQERGLRSGTENVANISGLSLAFEIANKMRDKETLRLGKIQDYAIDKILNLFPKSSLNGSRKYRLPNNVNICFDGLDAEFAVISLDVAGISASYSSSCRTLKEDSSSYVVESLGKEGCGKSSLRFTFGRETKKSDIDFLITSLKRIML